ncbi:chromate transporter [Sporosarcina obsidiansis]|uniref:chromate transporter n=1 Tax=Sporosarcina obsidiansis TaxID=2660748 RepID=UPI00129BAFC8|nr:chromate transporter [Sporosarcina obsidiansis]
MNKHWKTLLQVFWTFFKIGPVTFGGGFAMIPLIEKEIVDKRKWLQKDDVSDVFALAQSVPGAIAINSATFIGHRIAGVKGAIAAMLGISLPTFLIVLSLGITYLFIQDSPKIEAAFVSIRASIVAIIIYAAIKVGKSAIIDKSTLGILVIGTAALFFIHPLFMILFGGVHGSILIVIKKKLGYKIAYEKSNKKDSNEDGNDFFMGAGI